MARQHTVILQLARLALRVCTLVLFIGEVLGSDCPSSPSLFLGTVFGCGQTSSGKTSTMTGSEPEPGVIPLTMEEIFKYI